MQAFGRKDQRRVALRVGLPTLAFACRLADALAGMKKDGAYKKIIDSYDKRFAP